MNLNVNTVAAAVDCFFVSASWSYNSPSASIVSTIFNRLFQFLCCIFWKRTPNGFQTAKIIKCPNILCAICSDVANGMNVPNGVSNICDTSVVNGSDIHYFNLIYATFFNLFDQYDWRSSHELSILHNVSSNSSAFERLNRDKMLFALRIAIKTGSNRMRINKIWTSGQSRLTLQAIW